MNVLRAAPALVAVLLLTACAVPPEGASPAPASTAAAPPLRPLARQPAHPSDAAPRSQVTALRYELFGPPSGEGPEDGVPGDDAAPRGEVLQRGGASWYGLQFHNRKTANGELFNMDAFTAAHRTLPFGSRVCVRSLVNGKEVLVRVNDRGPYAAGRIIDLSRAAASAIDMLGLGIKQVALTLVERDGRCGTTAGSEADAPPAPVERRASARRRR